MTTRVPYAMTDAPLNVRAYGTKGDGATDDTAAFQAALDAAAGKHLVLVAWDLHLPLEPAEDRGAVDVELALDAVLADELDQGLEVAQRAGVDLKHGAGNRAYGWGGRVGVAGGWAALAARASAALYAS